MKKIAKKYLLIIFGAVFLIPAAIFALNTVNEGFKVDSGTISQINAHGTCKNVKNNNPDGIFVPTNTAAEWDAFQNSATNVNLSSCTSFVSVWDTTKTSAGSSANKKIRLPLHSGGSYNFTVDWGDGTSDTITAYNQPAVTHTYATSGTYEIKISGTIVGWRFNNTGDRNKILDIKEFGPLRLGNLGSYFYGANNLKITATDVLDTTGTTNMSYAFAFASSLNTVPSMDSWDMSNVTNMSSMFYFAQAFNQPIGNWNTGNVTNMHGMFLSAQVFNQPIGNWNTSNVTNMAGMLSFAQAFNQPIGNWNTGKVTNMTWMFDYAQAFNQPIGNWNTGKVTNMAGMFDSAQAFNQPIGNWNTGKVTDMSWMFSFAQAFNQPIGNWDTGKVTDMHNMFLFAQAFNQPIGNWNTGNVTNMASMFHSAQAFNQPIGNWNTGKVTDMSYMFNYATVFNQSLNTWNVNKVTSCSNFNTVTPQWTLPKPNFTLCTP